MKMKSVGSGLWAPPGVPSQCCRKALWLISRFHHGDRNYTRLEDRGVDTLRSILVRSGACSVVMKAEPGYC